MIWGLYRPVLSLGPSYRSESIHYTPYEIVVFHVCVLRGAAWVRAIACCYFNGSIMVPSRWIQILSVPSVEESYLMHIWNLCSILTICGSLIFHSLWMELLGNLDPTQHSRPRVEINSIWLQVSGYKERYISRSILIEYIWATSLWLKWGYL